MRVKNERSDAERENRKPEVDEVGNPYRQRGVEQKEEVAHAHVDARPGKAGVQDSKRDASCRKPTARSDISCATKSQVAEDGLGIDLSRKDLEDWR